MLTYIIRRLLIAMALVITVSVLSHLAIHLIPGDPAYLILGAEMAPDPEQLVSIRHQMGLDRSIFEQVARGVWGLFTLDLGTSLQDGRPVIDLIKATFPVSLVLVVSSTFFAVVFGISLGSVAAIKHNSKLDWFASILATLGISTPVFVSGTFLIYFFCIELHWVPATGYVPLSEDPEAFLKRLILPMLTAGFAHGAEIARMTRSCMLETLKKDYMTTARSKGLRERTVLIQHGLRTALIPVVAMIGIQFGSMFGRTVLIETIFSWPGLMSTMVSGARFHDFPVVRGIMVVIATIFILINLITDISYAYLDPRIVYD